MLQLQKKIAKILEYKIGNNAIIANFVRLWKTQMSWHSHRGDSRPEAALRESVVSVRKPSVELLTEREKVVKCQRLMAYNVNTHLNKSSASKIMEISSRL